LLGNQNL